jgi:hypothetical protein
LSDLLAITTPEKFNLELDSTAYSGGQLSPQARKGLVYISKTFTALCNHKPNSESFNEEFMNPMISFLTKNRPKVRDFILGCMEEDEEEETPFYPEEEIETTPASDIQCEDNMIPFLIKCVPRMRKDISLAVTLPNGATFFQPSTMLSGTNAISAGTLMSGSFPSKAGPGPIPRQINNNTWETDVAPGTYIPGVLTPASSFRIPASQISLPSVQVYASESVCRRALRNLEMLTAELSRWEEIRTSSKQLAEAPSSHSPLSSKAFPFWKRWWAK